jgi:Ca2+-transporting ATPase
VNESILTGNLWLFTKDKSTKDESTIFEEPPLPAVGYCNHAAIGSETNLGKIGKSLEEIKEKTPLELQLIILRK